MPATFLVWTNLTMLFLFRYLSTNVLANLKFGIHAHMHCFFCSNILIENLLKIADQFSFCEQNMSLVPSKKRISDLILAKLCLLL
jgi:hypothetical protein